MNRRTPADAAPELAAKDTKSSKQSPKKASCTFHLPHDVRENLQALSFVTRTPQNQLVEEAVRSLIERKGIVLPQR
jgi:hypothetical protein